MRRQQGRSIQATGLIKGPMLSGLRLSRVFTIQLTECLDEVHFLSPPTSCEASVAHLYSTRCTQTQLAFRGGKRRRTKEKDGAHQRGLTQAARAARTYTQPGRVAGRVVGNSYLSFLARRVEHDKVCSC